MPGWRIPFAMGAVLAIVALWLRRQLDETSQKEVRMLKEAGTFKGLWRNRKAFLMVLGFTAGGSLSFYTFTTYMQKYGEYHRHARQCRQCGHDRGAVCLYAHTADRRCALGQNWPTYLNAHFGGLSALCTVPILTALQHVSSPYAAFALVMVAMVIVSFYTSISGILKAEMFPAQVRALGVGLSYAVANAVFGGSAEYVALSLKSWEAKRHSSGT